MESSDRCTYVSLMGGNWETFLNFPGDCEVFPSSDCTQCWPIIRNENSDLLILKDTYPWFSKKNQIRDFDL
jgi:hypothetical protein